MSMRKNLLLVPALLLVLGAGLAAAGERADLMFTNSLDQEIVSVRVKYSTPYGEPRHSSSHIFLPPERDYRIGVQGVILPERILIDLATKTFDFADLSGLDPTNDMRLEVAHVDGRPVLRRQDGDTREIQGAEHDYLTSANRPNAVDRDYLTSAKTWDEVRELVEETAAGARNEQGKLEGFDLEAGPIWNNDNAQERCPEAVKEWNEANDGNARWTGHWTTTVPGEMSVCNCLKGTAGLAETLFEEDAGWTKTLYFPVFWMKWFGSARVQVVDRDRPDLGFGADLRFRLPDGGVAEMLDELQSDLRVDDFRPWAFRMKTWDGENEESKEVEVAFHEGEGDKYDDQDAMQEQLFAAYEDGSLVEATAVWVNVEAFEKAKAGEEPPASQGVMVLFSKGTFEAVFVPDGRMLMR